jgi:beta-galactosidase/beta-glucuronidase
LPAANEQRQESGHAQHAFGYPRPQLVRPDWTDLGGRWQFTFDDDEIGLDRGWHRDSAPFDREIVVPFPPESPASGIHETGFHPVIWYRRTFSRPLAAPGQHVLLHFGAIDYRARVWVDGQLIAEHEGGHSPFSADITDQLSTGGEHVIVVRAEDRPEDLAQPRGKQDWRPEPHAIWYHRTTGIWQPVWLETVAPVHIADIAWKPDREAGAIGIRVRLSGQPEAETRLRVRLSIRGRLLADDTFSVIAETAQRAIWLDPAEIASRRDEITWSPNYPNLIDAEVTLISGETVIDRVSSYVGLRSVGTEEGRFTLNARPYFLRMVLGQNYWPESHLGAPSDDALRREVEWIKALGFNCVRIHQKAEDPRFLAWCDRLGLLVWGEMANAFVFTEESCDRLTREWLDIVRRDASHPCIVAWVPINESWGVPNIQLNEQQRAYDRALYHLTKSIDPSRPVIGNDGWEQVAGDILTIHDYTPDADLLSDRYGDATRLAATIASVQPGNKVLVIDGDWAGKPVMVTEFGGIGYEGDPGKPWFGYGTVRTAEEFLERYRDLVTALLDSTSIAGFCYTQLTDTVQERNGLLTENREPKLDVDEVYAITSRTSRAIGGDVVAKLQSRAAPKPMSARAPGKEPK